MHSPKGKPMFRVRLPAFFVFALVLLWPFEITKITHAQGTINFNPPPLGCVPPSNDNFTNAAALGGGNLTVTNDLRCATAETDEPAHDGAPASRSLWYRWTADQSGSTLLSFVPVLVSVVTFPPPPILNNETVSAAGSGVTQVALPFPDRLVVYRGTSLATLETVPFSSSRFDCIKGETYYFAVDAASSVGGLNLYSPFILSLRVEGLRLNSLTTPAPLVGEENQFQIAALNADDILEQVTVSLAGIPFATNTTPPFIFSATSPTNGTIPLTASAQTTDGRTLNLYTGSLVFRPANDDFSHAITLPELALGQPQNYSTFAATREAAEPAHLGTNPPLSSLWWKWTPTHAAPTAVNAGTAGLAIYKGESLANIEPVLDIHPGSSQLIIRAWGGVALLQSQAIFTNEVGVTYWIAAVSSNVVSSWNMAQQFHSVVPGPARLGKPLQFTILGDSSIIWPESIEVRLKIQNFYGGWIDFATNTITNPTSTFTAWTPDALGPRWAVITFKYPGGGASTLSLSFTTRPVNDNFADAIELPGDLPPAPTLNFSYATAEPGEPPFGTNAPIATLWWRWTPTQNMDLRFRSAAPWYGTPLDIFTGSSLANLTRIAHNDGRANNSIFEGWVPLKAIAGQTYYIRVEGPSGSGVLGFPGINFVAEPLNAPLRGMIYLATAAGVPNAIGDIDWKVYARVFTADGLVATGMTYRADFYCGRTLETLATINYPVLVNDGYPSPILAGSVSSLLIMPNNLLAGESYLIQLRAWDVTKGYTYEQARASGGAVGRSEIVSVIAGSELAGFSFPTNISDIHLAAAATTFIPGFVSVENATADALRVTGPQGIYVIESSDLSSPWTPTLVVTNNPSGMIIFNRPPSTNTFQIYRSRLID